MYRLLFSKIFIKNNILKNKNLEFKCEISKISYPVNIKVTNRKKTISVRIDKNKILVNTPNFVKEEYILKILEKKRKWISKVILENNKQYNSGLNKMETFYLGKKYKINLKKGLNNEIILKNNNLEITYKRKNTKIKNILKKWYKKQCFHLLEKRINFFAKKINVEYADFLIRTYKRRLGSCDNQKRISFNWKLIFMPADVIDYVIIHELCHLIHFNHSKCFWNEVFLYCPNYKDHKKWIIENFSILKY